MLLRKEIEALNLIVNDKDETQFEGLKYVKVEEDGAVTSSTPHMAFRSKLGSDDNFGEFNKMLAIPALKPENYPVYIPKKTLTKAIKNLPKKSTVALVNTYLVLEAEEKSVKLTTTDLEGIDQVIAKTVHANLSYPDVAKVIEMYNSDDTAHVVLRVKELEKVLKMAKKFGAKLMELGLGLNLKVGEEGSVQFDELCEKPVMIKMKNEEGQSIEGVLMPCSRS